MPSPFPGMDPYLEGYLWPDFQHQLATQISRELMPQIRPKYVARIEVQVIEDKYPDVEVGIMYPDVEIVTTPRYNKNPFADGGVAVAEMTPATLELPILHTAVNIPTVEIRDTAHNKLVTSIEILSPVNKRKPHLSKYRAKRRRLYEAGVHLLEIDLLRRGKRAMVHPRVPKCAYVIGLTRAGAGAAQLWALQLADRLPTIPVPLRHPDPDVPLALSSVLDTIYDEAAYDLSLDYSQAPPPPKLSAQEQKIVTDAIADNKERFV